MIVTRSDAERLLTAEIGKKPRIMHGHIGMHVPSRAMIASGRPAYAWQAIAKGRDSAVRIGHLKEDGTIDWDGVRVTS